MAKMRNFHSFWGCIPTFVSDTLIYHCYYSTQLSYIECHIEMSLARR